MRTLEIRRHSVVKKDSAPAGSELSAEGVALARRLGERLGPFAGVYTSPMHRTLETAIAMGQAVTRTLDVLGDVPTALVEELGHHDRRGGLEDFATLRQRFDDDISTRRLGFLQRQAWLAIAEEVPDSSSALIISHGTVIEAGLIAAAWSDTLAAERRFGYCEGIRLNSDGLDFFKVELLRVESPSEAKVR